MIYPAGCRPVTDDLGPDELIRRLKVNTIIMSYTQCIYYLYYNFIDFSSYASSNGSR
jgi:hypothetical protein